MANRRPGLSKSDTFLRTFFQEAASQMDQWLAHGGNLDTTGFSLHHDAASRAAAVKKQGLIQRRPIHRPANSPKFNNTDRGKSIDQPTA